MNSAIDALPSSLGCRLVEQDGHWLWSGACDPDGYGVLTVAPGTVVRVHREVWALLCAPISGQVLVGQCPYRRCANPQHYKVVSRSEANGLRLWTASRPGRRSASLAADRERADAALCDWDPEAQRAAIALLRTGQWSDA